MRQDASQSIARFISALQRSGVKLDLNGIPFDLNAEEIANLLWLTLEINKNSSPVASKESAEQSRSTIADPSEIPSVVETPIRPSLPTVPQVPLVAERPQSDSKSTSALPISVPDAPALPRTLELSRSLRPLMRKVKSHYAQILDEDATIQQIADEKIWSPVMQSAPERWLELAIVVEETNLLEVWQKTIVEFQALMERHGTFRDVRTWQLVNSSEGKMQLFRRKAAVVDRAQPRHPKELLDPTGRRLILFVSDCTSVGWKLGRVGALLQEWMRQNPVTVLQLLPERFWERSALGLGEFVWLGAESPGGRTDQFTIEGFSNLPKHSILLPIVTLDPKALLQWARVIAGRGGFFTTGVLLSTAQLADYGQIEAESAIDPSEPTLLVQRFRETASPIARRLAEMMAAVPVSPSIVRLIQRNLLPQAKTVHLAEVFLSGLLRRVAPVENEPQRLQPRYEFFDGVRQRLLRVVLIPDTEQVMDQVADDVLKRLPDEVRQLLSQDIERRLGRSMRSFEAFLLPELLEDLAIDEKAKAEVLPFAAVTREVLQGLGKEYADWVEELTQSRIPNSAESENRPLDEAALYDALNAQIDYFQQEILDYFVRQNYQFEAVFPGLRPKELSIQPIPEEICLAEGEELSLTIVERRLVEVLEDYASFELEVRINFAVELSYLDADEYHPEFNESPTIEEIIPDQTINAVAEVALLFSEDDHSEIEPELIDLRVEQPILIDPRDGAAISHTTPLLLEFEFETGVIDETLQPFEFTVATIEVQRRTVSVLPRLTSEGLERLEAVLQAQSLTLSALAKSASMDRNTIAKIRRRTEPVRLNTLQKFFSHLGLELEESDYEYYTNDLIAGVAVLRQMKGIPHLVIHRHLAQAWQFIEMLNEAEVVLEMVSIPGGSFLMGSPEDELEHLSSESPQNSVTVDSFFIGKYPITQAQWRIVAEFEQVNRSLDLDPSRFKGDDRPVENVSWHDAVEFCDRLSRFTGKEYRLPTEAEWEYACRAGTQTPFHFGETITTDLANYCGTDNKEFGWSGSYGDGPTGIYRGETIPVGSLGVANNFGLYDMHGNVWEWCQDHWHDSYEGAPTDGSAWINPDAGENASRVLRGGSWYNDPGYCRSATRNDDDAGIRNDYDGFRVVCSAPRTL